MSLSRQASHPLLRSRPVIAIIAFLALILTAVPTLQANAADGPPAGSYEGTSDAYTGATVSFDIDSDGFMSNFDSESYCSDGSGVYPVQWVGMPSTQIGTGVPFEIEWEYDTGDVSPYYELTGVVNADGSASGTGRAGFLPYGTCGGMNFTWTAENTSDPEPVYDPEASVSPSSLTESELADGGVVIEGQDFPPNTSVELLINGSVVDNEASLYNGNVIFNYSSSSLVTGTHNVQLRAGVHTADTSFTVNADPEPTYDPEASVSPSSLTESELADSGVMVTGTDFPANSNVSLSVAGANVGSESANADGEVTFGYTSGSLGAGSHQVVLTQGDLSASTSFTVTADPEPVYDPEVSVSPSSLTESELADSGVTITGSDFPAGADVALSVGGSNAGSQTADSEGEVTFNFTSSSLGVGSHTVVLTHEDLSASTSVTVTDDQDPVYNPEASVTPEELTESELTGSGVTVTGIDFLANSSVSLSVAGSHVSSESANADGEVTFTFTSDSLGVGSHQVALTQGDLSAETSFTVTEDDPVYNPGLSVSPSELTESELADTGVTFTGQDFPENAEVSLAVAGSETAVETSDGTGEVVFEYVSDSLGQGEHTVRLEADAPGAWIESVFVVTPDAEDPDPETIPAVAPTENDLSPALEGEITAPSEATPGDEITVTAESLEAETEIGVWLFSDPIYLGTQTVDANGQVTVTIPADTEIGAHTVGVWTEDGLVGWDAINIVSVDSGGGSDGSEGDSGEGDSGGEEESGGASDDPQDGLAVTGGSPTTGIVLGSILLLLVFGSALLARTRRDTTE
ncbi:MAG: hypothetical protein ACTHW3_10260 [Leucobacter sp.]